MIREFPEEQPVLTKKIVILIFRMILGWQAYAQDQEFEQSWEESDTQCRPQSDPFTKHKGAKR